MTNHAKRSPAGSADKRLPEPLPQILELRPYVQGKASLAGRDDPIKLSSNENCLGPSPAAMAAYAAAATHMHRYPDGSQTHLRKTLARVHKLDAGRIVCGNGSEELIGLLVRSFVGADHELLLTENHFVMCSIYGAAQGASLVFAPEKDFRIDVDEVLARITSRTRMIAIANPNNPTGTYLGRSDIQRLVDNTPGHVIIILDGAYAEYVTRSDFDAGASLVDAGENVVMTRTFSKIHGLAGLRIGWAYGPSRIIEFLNRVRTPFNANRAAMAAAAAAAADQHFLDRAREHNRRSLDTVTAALTDLGLVVVPSEANFYLIDFSGQQDKTAASAVAFLESRNIIPRPGGGTSLRITVGTDAENQAVVAALRDYMAA